ncbi:MAG: NIPSNAP family protein [Acetobacteraceae bacterium]
MSVLAIFRYDVAPGRMDEFMAKLGDAASARFTSPAMPNAVRLFRSATAGRENLTLLIEYNDRAAYDARTAYETANPEWRRLFDPAPDSPERLISREVLTETWLPG